MIWKSWLTEYGDLVALIMVFFVLLYTISWATEANVPENSESLVNDSYAELKDFCEHELSPEDYELERVKQGVLVHLPTDRWFQKDEPVIKPVMKEHLKKLTQKISELKLLTLAPPGESGILFSSESGASDFVRIQLSITQLQEQAGHSFNYRTDDLFLARAKQIAIALNETLRVRDYRFEVNPDQSGMVQAVRAVEPLQDTQSHSNLTLLISASFKSN
ncbi:MAG: hypothetical protein K9N34_02140 [Candidatus Marinimicrobia bacterium]|nr:hypothetical protein [Candidatus Neomarinimicrobiota bacterium]MCF7839659.1 hypothetical protein [Candidatus Neomarinimicrobiota bacterium]